MSVVGYVQLADQPRHVVTQCAHRLHALLVLTYLPWSLAVDHVPVLRTDHGHVHNREVLVKTVEGCRCSATTAYHHAGCRLVLQMPAQGIEHTVE